MWLGIYWEVGFDHSLKTINADCFGTQLDYMNYLFLNKFMKSHTRRDDGMYVLFEFLK